MDQQKYYIYQKNKILQKVLPRFLAFLLFLGALSPAWSFSIPVNAQAAPDIVSERARDYEGLKLIVSFKNKISKARMNKILSLLPNFSLLSFDGDMALLKARSYAFVTKALSALSSMEDVALVQPNYPYSQADIPANLPNDIYFDNQWGLYNDGSSFISTASQRNAKAGVDINVLNAWASFQSSKEVVVAVIDTGVDYNHPDLKRHILVNTKELNGKKGVDDDKNGYVDDVYGWDFYNNDSSVCHYNSLGKALSSEDDNHGTHCAGIIAASRNNNSGISGVASNVNIKILPVKALGGTEGVSDSYTLALAIRYAALRGAKICNASWTTRDDDPVLKSAMLESNMLFVCASGNNTNYGGDNLDRKKCYPASFKLPNTVTVSAIDSDGKLSYYANYGVGTVALAAPGTRIVSSIVGSYAYMTGTSMAAPFVTGVAAMLYAKKSTLTPVDMVKILSSSTTPLLSLNGKVASGGIIDAKKALDAVDGYVPISDKLPPNISVSVTPYRNYAILQSSVKDQGNSYLLLSRYASGKKSAAWFARGKNGKSFGTKLTLNAAGYYTFYAIDSAGNEKIKTVRVAFDKKPPTASLKATKKKGGYQVRIQAKDTQSGLKQIRYLAGNKKAAAFKNGKTGKKVAFAASSSTAVLTLKKKGTYSFYFQDKAGNAMVKVLKIKK